MTVENILEKEKKQKEKESCVAFIFLLFAFFCIMNVFVTKNENYAGDLMTALIIPIMTFISLVYFIPMVDEVIVFNEKIWNNKRVNDIFKKYYEIKYKVPKTEYNYFVKGASKEFVEESIKILKDLPIEYEYILKNYPIRFKFIAKRKQSKVLGLYKYFFDNLETGSIEVYNFKKNKYFDKGMLKETIYHEVAHHVDAVFSKEFYMKNGGDYFSKNDKAFNIIYKLNRLNLDEYFLREKKEYFAETMGLCMDKKIEDKTIVEFYDLLFKVLMKGKE